MEIAILSRYYNREFRGVETFVGELLPRLQKLGYLVSVYPQVSPNLSAQTEVVISTNGRVDVLHAKYWCLVHHSKLIIPGQSGIGFDDRLNLFTFPDTFVSLTAAQDRWVKTANPFVSTTVIPNGVDLVRFHPKSKHTSQTIVLNVAALEPSKRQDLLIQAVAKTDYFLRLVGQGSRQASLLQLAHQLLPGRFEITSFPHDQMPGVYSAADVFAYPTVPWEAFGIAMVEAMASGLPVVATADPIRREIVGAAGLFVDPADTPAFTAALTAALHTNWMTQPRDQAKHYDWDQIALQYDQLIKQLCSR